MKRCLEATSSGGIAIEGVEGRTFTPAFLDALLKNIENLPAEDIARPRISKLGRRHPRDEGLPWFVGGQLAKIGVPRPECRRAAELLLRRLPLAAVTPKAFQEREPRPEDILTEKMLGEALFHVEMSDPAESVAARLTDPLELIVNGLVITVSPQDRSDEFHFEHDFTLPVELLGILKTLQHAQSEKVFKDWLLVHCSQREEDAQVALRFLRALVNFTTFLDSDSQMALWQPPETETKRGPEVLLQPFHSLLRIVDDTQRMLQRADPKQSSVETLSKLQVLVRLRYGEVYNSLKHHTSLYTVSREALVPSSQDFTQLVVGILDKESFDDPQRTAAAIIRLAESLGVKDMGMLEEILATRYFQRGLDPEIDARMASPDFPRKAARMSRMHEAIVWEAGKAGLTMSQQPEASIRSAEESMVQLLEHPWQDAAEINYANIINEGTTALNAFALSGTYGPFTRGHGFSIRTLLNYLETRPKTSPDGKRVSQDIIVIAPVPDISRIDYHKSPSRIGQIEARIGSMLLQLADVDRRSVFITTTLQPDAARAKTAEERVRSTTHQLLSKIAADMRAAHGIARFNWHVHLALGSDEARWIKRTRELRLAPLDQQPQKVMEEDGVMVVRYGHATAVLENAASLSQTGIRTFIFTPGHPASSTKAIEEIALTGKTTLVEPLARSLVEHVWSPQAIAAREGLPPPAFIPSVGEIYKLLVTSKAFKEAAEGVASSERVATGRSTSVGLPMIERLRPVLQRIGGLTREQAYNHGHG